jgi:hypothetical protein
MKKSNYKNWQKWLLLVLLITQLILISFCGYLCYCNHLYYRGFKIQNEINQIQSAINEDNYAYIQALIKILGKDLKNQKELAF